MSHLSERAEAVKTRLEGEWSRALRQGTGKQWHSGTLVELAGEVLDDALARRWLAALDQPFTEGEP